ncbi:hypothetical protein FSP39_013091 [Pinctada imbricata]|uniref:C-type lectin domain-containing protein n=1 Tax=Pinctada imbricata TaxID=66713 RepID=A0AA89C4W6_PINIB|nr:hypothetical protein FSP39_013091 [Pinctada imbricata]
MNTSLYDKRDDFNFSITNFPFLSSNIPSSPAYGVFISQLIRYARASTKYTDFVLRARRLSEKLLSQGYVCDRLTSSLRKFYGRYGELVIHYDVPLSRMNFCRSLGGGLAAPSTPGEHRFLKRIARHSGEGLIWIGVADFIEEGKWLTFPYTWYAKYVNWGGNEPNGGAGENCAVMSRGYDYRWADYSCSNVFKFICERAK